jgi:hypothetical protein
MEGNAVFGSAVEVLENVESGFIMLMGRIGVV